MGRNNILSICFLIESHQFILFAISDKINGSVYVGQIGTQILKGPTHVDLTQLENFSSQYSPIYQIFSHQDYMNG